MPEIDSNGGLSTADAQVTNLLTQLSGATAAMATLNAALAAAQAAIGALDLSNFYTKAQADTLLAEKATTASVATKAEASALSGYVQTSRDIATTGLLTGGGNLSANRTLSVPKSSNAQAVAGVDDATAMTPIRVKDAIVALTSGLGYGQSWQSPSRSIGTTYVNETDRPIMVVTEFTTSEVDSMEFQVKSPSSSWVSISAGGRAAAVVPKNHSYRWNQVTGSSTITRVVELRA